MNKKIVTIGGGHGQSSLLQFLKKINGVDITAIVSMFDNGSSTGELMKKYNCLPTGDIVKCLVALAKEEELIRKFFLKRIKASNVLDRHYLINFALVGMDNFSGDFIKSLEALSDILEVQGKVLPVTIDKADLVAELEDGSIIEGETNIDIPEIGDRARIKNINISRETKLLDQARIALEEADYIILTYGDLYTSLLPNFLVNGMRDSIINSKAKIIYFPNIITKKGETDNFQGEDFALEVEKYLGKKIDIIIANNQEPKPPFEGEFVKFNSSDDWEGRSIIQANLLDPLGTGHKRDKIIMKEILEKIL